MKNTKRATSRLTVDEAEYMRAALCALPDDSQARSSWHKMNLANAKSSFIKIIGISLDPTKNGYDLAIEVAEFRNNAYFRSLGFSSFTEWCKKYSFSPRTISSYWKTFYDLSVKYSIDLEVYENLSPRKVAEVIKPLMLDEPNYPEGAIDTQALLKRFHWINDLECCLKTAK